MPSLQSLQFDISSSDHIWDDFKGLTGSTLLLYPHLLPTNSNTSSPIATNSAKTALPRVLLVGLGRAKSMHAAQTYRTAIHTAISACQKSHFKNLHILLPNFVEPSQEATREEEKEEKEENPAASTTISTSTTVAAVSATSSSSSSPTINQGDILDIFVRVSMMSYHWWKKYITRVDLLKSKSPIKSIHYITQQQLPAPTLLPTHLIASVTSPNPSNTLAIEASTLVDISSAYSRATLLSRELANERGDVLTPATMQVMCEKLYEKLSKAFQKPEEAPLKIKVVHERELVEKEQLRLLATVGMGAQHKARLVLLEYNGAPSSSTKVALVGKGLTFDTGGHQLKMRGSIEQMHLDKSGSCAVLASFGALVELKAKVNVVAVLALAENSIGSHAVKPLTIVPTPKGSVEITDTDAEGRLALADAMMYVQKYHQPTHIIDIATLTGACVVALGENHAGLFSNNDGLADNLQQAATATNERVWRLPVSAEFGNELKGQFSDYKNISGTRFGGASTAAAFLSHFVDPGVHWAHLDIAGPAMLSKPNGYSPAGGTGFGAQILTDATLRIASQEKN